MSLAVALSLGVQPMHAAADPSPPNNPIDVWFYSQADPWWANLHVGLHEDVNMWSMGSLLTAIAMVATTPSYHLRARYLAGNFPDYVPRPDYLHDWLINHHGYQKHSPAKTVIVDFHALANAFVGPDNIEVGLYLDPVSWPGARDDIDRLLNRGEPSILYQKADGDPPRFHPLVVVGWDPETSSYLILDPAWGGRFMNPQPLRKTAGADWERRIAGALVPSIPLGSLVPSDSDDIPLGPLVTASTKSPVETLVVDPLGRRAGYDAATGATVIDIPHASYLPQPVWADPYGYEPPRGAGRLLTIRAPVEGRYRFQMIGVGDGPYTLGVRARDTSGGLTVDDAATGTVTAGEVIKYQVEYSRNGPSFFTMGENFEPEANAGGDRLTTVNATVAFDAGKSFDVDGTIASYRWEFGDGSAATGPQASHTYATAGVYTATLTVTDDKGAMGADAAKVSVYGTQAAGGTTERVSVATGGGQAAGHSFYPAMSADGRFVAFRSNASNLGGQSSNPGNVFVHDRQTGTTEAMNPAFCASDTPDISADGRFVAFECGVTDTATGLYVITVAVRDRVTGALERADVSSVGDGGTCPAQTFNCGSFRPAISADGRFVAFYSTADNLVPGDTNAATDVFVRDRVAKTTERVSLTSAGAESPLGGANGWEDRPGISADGRFVAFTSLAELVPGISAGVDRIFVRDRQQGATELVSVSGTGAAGNAGARRPSISADGRVVAFESWASNLVAGDTNGMGDVFLRDRAAGTTERASLSGANGETTCALSAPTECHRDPVVSADGRYVVFRSRSPSLVLNDANGVRDDVFIRDRQAGTTELVSVTPSGTSGLGQSGEGLFTNGATRMAVSADGRFVAFVSDVNNLVSGDTNAVEDIFVRDRRLAAAAGPQADASGPYIGWADAAARPAFVSFDASGSVDPAGRALTARWDFGDGTPVVTAPVGSAVTHAYASHGIYTAKLVVGVDGDDSSPVTTFVQIVPAPGEPAMKSTPACGQPGEKITLAVEPQPLIAAAGGWNLAHGELPSVRSRHQSNAVRLKFSGPASADLSDESAPIESFALMSPLDFSTTVGFAIRASWGAGTYQVSAPDDFGVGAVITVPCPKLANEPPQARVGGPYAGTAGRPINFNGSSSFDPEGKALTYRWSFGDGGTASGPTPTHTFSAPGTYTVALVVNDGQLDSPSSVGTRSLTYAAVGEGTSNRPPVCGTATPSFGIVWPPSHALVPVAIAGVTDPDDDPVTIAVTSVRQDEPVNGQGDGDTAPDATGVGTGVVSVRAERAGAGDGRVYHVGFTATDGKGGECAGNVTVCVPKDQGYGKGCVDQGPLFDSTMAP